MLPAILFGGHQQLIVGSPVQHASAGIIGHVGKRALGRSAAMPYRFCGARGGVGNPDGPGVRLIRGDEKALRGVALLSRPAHKRDAFAVGRPDKVAVGIHRRRNERNGFRGHIVQRDKAVVAAHGYEREFAAIRRPVRIKITSAHDKLLGLLRTLERRKPDLRVFHVGNGSPRRSLG